MKRALVTGCAGFIGSLLAGHLLQKGYEVTGIDCFTDNYSPRIKRANLASIQPHRRFTWIEGNLLKMDVQELAKKQHVIFHQAALPGVRNSWGHDFQHYVDHNISVTQKLLEAVKKSHVQKMIFASSSSIYGSMTGPTDETHPPSPYSPYGVTKLSAEHLCHLYYQNYGVPVVCLRYFTVYGPRQRPDMAFHRFMERILRKQPLLIYGQGEQTRDFTYVQDIIKANMNALQYGKLGESYNIGGGSRTSLLEVIHLLERLIGMKVNMKYVQKQPGDATHTWADIGKAKTDLGYEPQYSLEKGLSEQIGYIRSLYEIP